MTDSKDKQHGKDMPYQQGSVWRKWDLHIHSPLTILNNQYPKLDNGEPDWEKFITKLESLDVAVIAITDYFTIDGYKKVLEYKNKGRLPKIQTILPNIEFRLDKLISSKKDGGHPRRLNYHVIFSNEVSTKDIEEHFLHNLSFFYEGNPQGADTKEKLKTSNLEALGKKLKLQHVPFAETGDSDLKIGATQAVVAHEAITKELNSPRFKGKFIQVFPEELSNLMSWDGQDHHTRKGLLQKSDMVFSAQRKTITWCLGKSPYMDGADKFIEEFKTLKPCIHGSDAHKIEEIGHPCAKRGEQGHDCIKHPDVCELRYCWIKADPTFEGLKQIIYEPVERVRIQQEDPSPFRSNFTINKFGIAAAKINDELQFSGDTLTLNGGLVAVTGAKGSGKTAFVDLIANCYSNRLETNDPNSFVGRIAEDSPTLITNLVFKDGKTFTKDVKEKRYFENSDIVYIAQGELENYIADSSDFEDHVRKLIFENSQIRNSVKNFEFDQLVEMREQLREQLANLNQKISLLEQRTSVGAKQALNLQKKQADAELKDVEARIQAIEKSLVKEELELAQKKQAQLNELKVKRVDLSKLKIHLNNANNFLANDLLSFNRDILEAQNLLKKVGQDIQLVELQYADEKKIKAAINKVQNDLVDIATQTEQAQKELDKYKINVRDQAQLLEKKSGLKMRIIKLDTEERLLETTEKELQTESISRGELLRNLLQNILLQKDKYREIISVFSEQKTEILGDLSFGANTVFDHISFLRTAEDVLDNRRINIGSRDSQDGAFDEFLKIAKSFAAGDATKSDEYVNKVEQLAVGHKNKIKDSRAISGSDFYDFLFNDYFSVTPTVKYKGVDLRKLSLGQKATVLIKIHLAQGDRPIIIDSHDDHLDNEFIMDELVVALRHAKQFRQIILASNNGNVVINSDADQIVLATRDGEVISYSAGSIENPEIRDRAVKVLEGGALAFKQRQQKYRLFS